MANWSWGKDSARSNPGITGVVSLWTTARPSGRRKLGSGGVRIDGASSRRTRRALLLADLVQDAWIEVQTITRPGPSAWVCYGAGDENRTHALSLGIDGDFNLIEPLAWGYVMRVSLLRLCHWVSLTARYRRPGLVWAGSSWQGPKLLRWLGCERRRARQTSNGAGALLTPGLGLPPVAALRHRPLRPPPVGLPGQNRVSRPTRFSELTLRSDRPQVSERSRSNVKVSKGFRSPCVPTTS
jgi:hypothetical protein